MLQFDLLCSQEAAKYPTCKRTKEKVSCGYEAVVCKRGGKEREETDGDKTVW